MTFAQAALTILMGIADGVAYIAIVIDQLLGGVFGGTSFVMGACRQLAGNVQRGIRAAKMLWWFAVISIIMLAVAINYDVRPLLVVICVFWALVVGLIAGGLKKASQLSTGLGFLLPASRVLAAFVSFMLWFSFMAYCGAFYVLPWSVIVATTLFLVFLYSLGVGKPVWAKRLGIWTATLVFLTAVIPEVIRLMPAYNVPFLSPAKRLVTAMYSRTTVETNKVARGVQPGVLEQREPDRYYFSVRPSMIRNCFDCVDSSGNVQLSKVGVPAEIEEGKWMAQVPRFPHVFTLNMRSYILAYRAWHNNPDGGFVQDPMEMFFAPVDSIEEREIPKPNNEAYLIPNQKISSWIIGALGVAGFTVFVLLAWWVIRFVYRKINPSAAPPPAPAPQHPTHGAGH